jgi:hypothetical protein
VPSPWSPFSAACDHRPTSAEGSSHAPAMVRCVQLSSARPHLLEARW